jgi:hypothetical protein
VIGNGEMKKWEFEGGNGQCKEEIKRKTNDCMPN